MSDLYDRMREEGLIDPVLVRASIACQVGKECPFPTIKAMADRHGVHPEQLRSFIKGVRSELEPKLARAFGLERVVFYRPASRIEAAPADETRSGSAEGESLTGEAGDAQTTPSENPS